MKKKLLYSLLIITILLDISAGSIFAKDNVDKKEKRENRISKTVELKNEKDQLLKTKEKANSLIDKRINRLDNVKDRIRNTKGLSSDEKSILLGNVEESIIKLTGLKSKIDSETSAAAVKQDIREINTNFKVDSVLTPKMRLLVTISNLQALELEIQNLVPKLQDSVNQLKSDGKDVSSLQPLLDDINTRLKEINAKLVTDKNTVNGVSISTANSNFVFTQVRQDLADVKSNFAQIRHDIGKLKNLKTS